MCAGAMTGPGSGAILRPSGVDGGNRMGADCLLVLCTCPDAASAKTLATALLEERLAACVNRVPGIKSMYRWQDHLEQDDEELLIIKTRGELYPRVEKLIQALHPYELPEVIGVPIEPWLCGVPGMDRFGNDMMMKWILRNRAALAGLLLALAWSLPAAAEEDILKPEEAFRYSVEAGPEAIELRWDIAPEHYLYRERMSFRSRTDGVELGEPELPNGKPYDDEFFGRMEIYRGSVDRAPALQAPERRHRQMELEIRSQGCADIGLCYPPQRWTAVVDLPRAGGGSGRPAGQPVPRATGG